MKLGKILLVIACMLAFVVMISGNAQETPQTPQNGEATKGAEVKNTVREQAPPPAPTPSAIPPELLLEVDASSHLELETVRRQLDIYKAIAALVMLKNKNAPFAPFAPHTLTALAKLVNDAAQVETDECHSRYLSCMAANISQKSLFSCELPHWNHLENNRTEIIFRRKQRDLAMIGSLNQLFAFSPAGFDWDKDSIIQPVIYFNRNEDTLEARRYSELFARMRDHLPISQPLTTAYSPVVPEIKVCDLYFGAYPKNHTLPYPSINNIRFSETEEDSGGFKIIFFKNLTETYYENVIKAVAGKVLTPSRFQDLSYDIYFSNLIMTRFSHHLGPVFAVREANFVEEPPQTGQQWEAAKRKPKQPKPKKKRMVLKTISQLLKELFPVVENLKAQMLAVHNTEVLIAGGVLSEDHEEAVYSVYLVSLLDRLRRMQVERFYNLPPNALINTMTETYDGHLLLSDFIQLNHLLNSEAIRFNIDNGTIDIDPIKFKLAVEELSRAALSMFNAGSYYNCRQILAIRLQRNPQILEIMKLLSDIPLAITYELPGNALKHKQ